ncbi:hypothetical protein [Acidithiobacillus thiooxidans]|uniref:Uncharacterized protein n=1 Tax=Acidithiobacillus thiooxidans TaxID=930 RepID=A0A1C2J7K2_ACITH|nr:hypothetical protein [Acidithiobacillus thiooxidans]OCX71906.1 hypothetical protein A6M23_10865 [Acidithiobacillus thiooxidans]OCX84211.1 hypothetical protein A6P08_09375 [Acidithiobacillus thiooxidans]
MTAALKALLQGAIAVVLVLLAVLLLLALDGLLLIPGLMLAYTLMGLPWHWLGILPDPLNPPGPWISMTVGVIATLIPAVVDGIVLHFFLRK